ncbi:acyl-ACP--UDP-N-acetylglucosamine O-acyltransferase [Bremerella cremea]|uniref:Acyl-ACP--UDP-N-acetylglucosamine O-acyltransferase n=1 Tax=Bremerella cremea TaxID=1031537 RepID=A0A368KX28_9BACT|nr:acyl-ACP--UDP-N-acetylglucosamine O-acyltransferase [Bremerella cremea]RCS54901.1 acyl-ACP--UDP-N-acetylglucosamine O-acyltransferase [Bremerella cremea]
MPFSETTLISPYAQIADDVVIGEGCRIESGVVIGAGTQLADGVKLEPEVSLGENNVIGVGTVIKSGTQLGSGNQIAEYCVLGGPPLISGRIALPGRLCIGDRNVIREFATIQVGTDEDGVTCIGNTNYIMPNVQIGHDSRVGNKVTLTNKASLCGHVTIEDEVVLGLGATIHQHCRIGRLAMVGATAYVSRDIVPFVLVDGRSGGIVGLNKIGLARRGFSQFTISELKSAYRVIFREALSRQEITARLQNHPCPEVQELLSFLISSNRGIEQARKSK